MKFRLNCILWQFLLLLLVSNSVLFVQCSYTTVLESPRVTDWGTWGSWEYCPAGMLAFAIRLKTEEPSTQPGDETALNGIRLYCAAPGKTRNDHNSIESKSGQWGDWSLPPLSNGSCGSSGWLNSFQLRSEPWLGAGTGKGHDDTAATNLKAYCSSGEVIVGNQLNWGSWTEQQSCSPNEYICGIRTQVEDSQGPSEDDTSLNNVDFQCCSL